MQTSNLNRNSKQTKNILVKNNLVKDSVSLLNLSALTVGIFSALSAGAAIANNVRAEIDSSDVVILETTTVLAAKKELQQDPGLSVISKEAIEKQPVANDIAEIVRKMPGVNLSGSSTSGQRGNQRQIDLRGMGPDNTLILIDGRPVTSRMSVRPGRASEKDTRGDSQWVPPSAIEKIEVLRGPAAARYGSGSMGGVVNIITKAPTKREASIATHFEQPESSLEGSSYRVGVNLAGPVSEKLSYRTTLGYSEREADDPKINEGVAVFMGYKTNRAGDLVLDADGNKIPTYSKGAGIEGVENIDARQLFEYTLDAMNTLGLELSYGRQANRWAGDSQFQNINENLVKDLAGETTNKLTRKSLALIHKGKYENSDAHSYIEYTRTDNERLNEGPAGGGEGLIMPDKDGNYAWNKTRYDTLNAKTEWDIYFDRHTLTAGAEFRGEKLDIADAVANALALPDDFKYGEFDTKNRDTKKSAYLLAAYVEDNYKINPSWFITPGLRIDYHDTAGTSFSPSLNTTWHFNNEWSVKGGISHAFKAPGLYQLDPNYLYYTNGFGCPASVPKNQRGCHVLGNPNLDNEASWNKELTVNYNGENEVNAGLTYYRNDFDNRIAAGTTPVAQVSIDPTKNNGRPVRTVFLWDNQGKAIVEGVEGFVQVPVTDTLNWQTNLTSNIRSERKDNGEPLSLIPDYTINTNFDWAVSPRFNAGFGVSYYGPIAAPKFSVTTGDELTGDNIDLERKPYAIANLTTSYKVTDSVKLGLGIKNLFDEDVKREGTSTNAGARTFNEPGRAYTADLTMAF